jgi:hypothetical protein
MRAASVLKSDTFISEDDARRCADYISPHLQKLTDYSTAKYNTHEAVLWGLHWRFAFILYRLGNPGRLRLISAAYKALPASEHAAAQDCKERLRDITLDAMRKGFSPTAIAYAMLGPLSKSHAQVFRASLSPGRAEEEAGEVSELLFAALKEATLKNDKRR